MNIVAIKKIEDNVTVTLLSNYDGGVFLQNKNGEVFIDTSEYGEYSEVEYSDLRKLVNSNRALFKELTLLIVDTDNDEYTVEDVIKALRLEKEYESVKCVKEILDIDEFNEETLVDFINESDANEYKELLDSTLREAILNKTVCMYREGELKDFEKITIAGNNARSWYVEPQSFWNDVAVKQI